MFVEDAAAFADLGQQLLGGGGSGLAAHSRAGEVQRPADRALPTTTTRVYSRRCCAPTGSTRPRSSKGLPLYEQSSPRRSIPCGYALLNRSLPVCHQWAETRRYRMDIRISAGCATASDLGKTVSAEQLSTPPGSLNRIHCLRPFRGPRLCGPLSASLPGGSGVKRLNLDRAIRSEHGQCAVRTDLSRGKA